MKVGGFVLHRDFKKSFSKLHKSIRDAFEERISIFALQPFHILLNNHQLEGDWKGHWSINITGDIRAIYRLEGTIALFVDIGTHAHLYE
ncbi:MAG: type II toxin-antitoxin system mRNA interferase toxin, RelE/StbE family [Candidatus Pacebacteria bacterium]|nr:type II toxin-antitoxin system mRNA interferase toxin, RelE/StbE family [Candidatus Paceibacterota bacterium]